MADRTVKLTLSLETQGLIAGFRNAQRATQDFTSKLEHGIAANSQQINTLSNGLGIIGVAALGAVGLAVKKFAEFDAAISGVKATGEDAAQSIGLLREAALDAGAETVFSATQAANAIEEMAKAGVSAADILNGGLDGALNLAAAGQLDVAEAAGYASTAMTQFGLSGRDVSHVADLLAAGAGKAMGEVSDFGAALNQAGLVANATGLSIEETTGTLAAFASAGLLGSDAGTSLKTALQVLSAPSKESAALMKELGINAYDASGQFVGMADLAGQLTTAFRGKTDAERNSAMATIFGSDAVRAANVLFAEGEQGIRDWTTAVDDSGYAAEVAATKLDNLAGDFEAFTGSLETAMIGAGEGANGPLRSLVQGATDVVNAFSDLPGPIQQSTLLITGGAGLVALGVAGMGKLAVGVVEAKQAMQALGITTKAAGLAVGGVGAALAIAAVGLTVWAQNAAEAKARTEDLQSTLDEFGQVTDDTLSTINTALSQNRNDFFDDLFGRDPESLIDRAERLGLAVEDLQGYILGQADAVDRVTEATERHIASQDRELSQAEVRAEASRFLTGALDEQASALTDAQKAAGQKALADEAAGIATEKMSSSTQGATSSLQAQTEALEENWKAQVTAANGVLSLRDAQRAEEAAVDAATKALEENGATLDITTEKGRTNQAALDEVASSGWRVVDSMREQGSTAGELQGAMQATRDRFLAAAGAFGMGADEANRLADQMGLIPSQVSSRVDVNTEAASSELENFVARWNGKTIAVSRASVTYSASGGMPGGGTATTPPGFGAGGYTGNYATTAVAGVVHGQEFVVNADATARNRALLEKINAGLPGYANGGYVGASSPMSVTASVGDVVARLDPRDARALIDGILAGARDVAATMTASEIRHNSAVSQARGVVR